MKKIFVLGLSLFIFSCKKDGVGSIKKEIVGTWEIEKYSGYPFTQPPYPPGNGKIIMIGSDGNFERRAHDTLLFKGRYFVLHKKDCSPRESDLVLLTNETASDSYSYVDIENGKLTLTTPSCWADGGTAYYRRIQ